MMNKALIGEYQRLAWAILSHKDKIARLQGNPALIELLGEVENLVKVVTDLEWEKSES